MTHLPASSNTPSSNRSANLISQFPFFLSCDFNAKNILIFYGCSQFCRKGKITLSCICWLRLNFLDHRGTYASLPWLRNLVGIGSRLSLSGAGGPSWPVSYFGFSWLRLLRGQLTHFYTIPGSNETSEVSHQTWRLWRYFPVIDFWCPGSLMSELCAGVCHEHCDPSSFTIYPPVIHETSSHTCS